MKKSFIVAITLLSILTAGCGDEAESNKIDPITQPVEYRNNNENSNNDNNWNRSQMPLSAPQNEDENQNAASPYGKNDEIQLANTIRDEIRNIPGIHDVQATVTDGTVHVALDTEDEFRGNPNLINKVRSEVNHLIGDRKIRIYTDGAYFDRMRNISTNPEKRFEP